MTLVNESGRGNDAKILIIPRFGGFRNKQFNKTISLIYDRLAFQFLERSNRSLSLLKILPLTCIRN